MKGGGKGLVVVIGGNKFVADAREDGWMVQGGCGEW